jgi:CDP-glucose 4,6-dehydratase
MGTVHLLEAVRHVPGIKAVVVVSSDKCYENREQDQGYRETDPMGGHDPYSASKGCTELIVASYRRAFLAAQGVAVASARAGNVIGGGDWTASRLVPDVLAAFAAGTPVTLRNPGAIRPWQHVLEPLSGYLSLAQKLVDEGDAWAEGWNFGPADADAKTVAWVVEQLATAWGPDARWAAAAEARVHEAHILKLDCSKARARLGWQPRWPAGTAVARSLDWYQAWRKGADMHTYTLDEIAAFGSPS